MKNNKKSCDIASITAKILKKYTVQGLFLFNIAFLLYYITPLHVKRGEKAMKLQTLKNNNITCIEYLQSLINKGYKTVAEVLESGNNAE